MKNTAQNARYVMANGDSIESLRLNGSDLPAVASNGDINASNRKDLLLQIDALLSASANGEVVKQNDVDAGLISKSEAEEMVAQANSSPENWAALGANIAESIQVQADRAGFLRNIALGNNLRQGEYQRVPMPRHEVQAIEAASPTEMGYQLIRDRYYTPAEFEIKGNVRVSQLELDQSAGDLLRDIREQAEEAIITAEDRIWKRAADDAVGRENPITYIAGELTPKLLANIREQVTGWNLPASKAIIANDYWKDIVGNADFSTMLDPVSKYDLVLNGNIGTLIGLELMTDGYRPENQRVLSDGEIYCVSDPKNHAAYSTRGVRSTPTDGANQGETTKGWLLSQNFSFVLANVRSVSKGMRI